MRFQIPVLILLAVFCVFSAPKAQADETSVVVARMDVIIKQMEALKLEFAALLSAVGDEPSGSVLGAQTSVVFTESLEVGATNNDIKKIQALLATDPEIYPYGAATGFFGPKTVDAIRNFQSRFGLDSVGVIGPATKSLLEQFFRAYPDGEYPANVLDKKPEVKGISISVPSVPSVPVFSGANITKITAEYDGEEARVKISYNNDTSNSFLIEGERKIKVVEAVAAKLGRTKADILDLIVFTSGDDEDEDDEEDFDIDLEIDDDETFITFEFDGDDFEVEVNSTDEDDVLEEVADELNEDEEDVDEDLKDAIEDALDEALEDEDEDDGDSDEIESITSQIENGEAEIQVEYGNGDDEEFTVEEDLEAEIIEEVADELNIDEDEVEDIIEFEYEDVEEINVDIEKELAFVVFEDGTEKRIHLNSDDEDEIIEEIAEELDEDEEDVEEWIRFDY